jgi:hypothetical protein
VLDDDRGAGTHQERPVRYACCAPLATYLLTWPLKLPGNATQHLYTAAHLLAEDHLPQHHHQCRTTPPLPSGTQNPSTAAAYHKQQLLQQTHITSPSWQHNWVPTHSHYPNSSRPPATMLPPTQNNPPPPCHVIQHGGPPSGTNNPCMTHPYPAHGMSHHPEHLPGQHPKPTPQANTYMPCQRLPANNP